MSGLRADLEALAAEWEVLADYVDDPDWTDEQRARSRAGVVAAAQLRNVLTAHRRRRVAAEWWRRARGVCIVTGKRRCPYHPDGGNHPGVGQ